MPRAPRLSLSDLPAPIKAKDTAAAYSPDFKLERKLHENGFLQVCGVDEAGRGPLAGPVVAAAVVLNPMSMPMGVDDSKRLSAPQRLAAFDEILKRADVGIGVAPAQQIDAM
ncbi:MAG: ribonuclease HII, partial [Pseudomonadota bacterium]